MIDIPDSIFPQNKNGQKLCPKCIKTIDLCTCPAYNPAEPDKSVFTANIAVQKSGRKGKIVTIISGLPKDVHYLKKLAKTLKIKTASGGTFHCGEKNGVIEIQGNKSAIITKILKLHKIRVNLKYDQNSRRKKTAD